MPGIEGPPEPPKAAAQNRESPSNRFCLIAQKRFLCEIMKNAYRHTSVNR